MAIKNSVSNKFLSMFIESINIFIAAYPVCKCSCGFLSSADFFKINFLKKMFQKHVSISNSLDTDQDRQYVGPDMGSNCLQRLSADH